jgi:hypothetical protein
VVDGWEDDGDDDDCGFIVKGGMGTVTQALTPSK